MSTNSRQSAKHILIVDDSASMRQMIDFTLKGAGYTVHQAKDGRDALDKMQGKYFDLILSDIRMPNIDGFALLEAMKKQDTHKDTPFLFLTSHESTQAKLLARNLGATGYLVKPFDPAKLIDVVGKVIGSASAPRHPEGIRGMPYQQMSLI